MAPLSVDTEGVKPEGRRSGMPWLDLTIAVTAIVLSLISLAVAIGNARTQEKMVAATSWPLLQYSTSNIGDDGSPVIVMEIINEGSGPALLKHVGVTYRGKPVTTSRALLQACCGLTIEGWIEARKIDPSIAVVTSSVRERVIRPGERIRFLRMERREPVAAMWAGLEEARREVELEACYCSLFEECWRSDLESLAARRVRTCPPATTGYDQ
ncbi:MAG TPA: hypothetical protein VF699_13220 [Caulobacteraceae bacterium]|jgi:hypothetical protein